MDNNDLYIRLSDELKSVATNLSLLFQQQARMEVRIESIAPLKTAVDDLDDRVSTLEAVDPAVLKAKVDELDKGNLKRNAGMAGLALGAGLSGAGIVEWLKSLFSH